MNTPVETIRGYPVRVRRPTVGGRTYELLGPANYESLVDDPRVAERFRQDEYMPYWAEFWPACLILADWVAAWPDAMSGSRLHVLELACGLGLVGLVAAAGGHRVIMSDYDEDALAFVRESARRSGVPTPETRYIDWRERYDDLRPDRIVASEVLYETRSIKPIAEFIAYHLSEGGEALICDANRSTAGLFDSVARDCGLSVREEQVRRGAEGEWGPVAGRIFVVRQKEAAGRE